MFRRPKVSNRESLCFAEKTGACEVLRAPKVIVRLKADSSTVAFFLCFRRSAATGKLVSKLSPGSLAMTNESLTLVNGMYSLTGFSVA